MTSWGIFTYLAAKEGLRLGPTVVFGQEAWSLDSLALLARKVAQWLQGVLWLRFDGWILESARFSNG